MQHVCRSKHVLRIQALNSFFSFIEGASATVSACFLPHALNEHIAFREDAATDTAQFSAGKKHRNLTALRLSQAANDTLHNRALQEEVVAERVRTGLLMTVFAYSDAIFAGAVLSQAHLARTLWGKAA